MISDFQLLAQKIDQLAALANTLRSENATLRRDLAAVTADYDACREKMRQAQTRMLALIAQLPAPDEETEEEVV